MNPIDVRCMTTTAIVPATILIVEHDDCADALPTLLAELPGVGMVTVVGAADAALDAIDQLSASQSDAIAFDVGSGVTTPASVLPDVVLIDAQIPGPHGKNLDATIADLRRRLPEAAIVMLCLYPHARRGTAHLHADRCIRKDTSPRELRALIDDLRRERRAATSSLV